MRILCVVAHPDDESLWCGGALAQHARNSDEVLVVTLADGVGSRFRPNHRGPSREQHAAVMSRIAAFYLAIGVLNVQGVMMSAFDDQQADLASLLAITDVVTCHLNRHEPSLVYTHYVGDLNLDHRRVAEAVLVCTRNTPIPIRCMTPEWPARCVGPRFEPNVIIELSEADLAAKVQACLCYGEELRPYPHPRSERALWEQTTERFVEVRD